MVLARMSSMKFLYLFLLVSVVSYGCSSVEKTEPDAEVAALMAPVVPEFDTNFIEVDQAVINAMMDTEFEYVAELKDVTGGEKILGISTQGSATGTAQALIVRGKYRMLAMFEGLPDPQGTDFYEGWIVRRGENFDVLSTGKAEKVDGGYVNGYSSGKDLINYSFYVLTLEPDDGNPRPAVHILEGPMEK